MTEQPSIDWREVQRLFTETMTPAAAICQQHGIGRTALRLRAQREAWARPGPVRRGPAPKATAVVPEAPTAPAVACETAAEYLQAVVSGRVQPDPLRIVAAKALLPYESPRKRQPLVAAAGPKAQAKRDARDDEAEARQAWAARAAEVRRKLALKE